METIRSFAAARPSSCKCSRARRKPWQTPCAKMIAGSGAAPRRGAPRRSRASAKAPNAAPNSPVCPSATTPLRAAALASISPQADARPANSSPPRASPNRWAASCSSPTSISRLFPANASASWAPTALARPRSCAFSSVNSSPTRAMFVSPTQSRASSPCRRPARISPRARCCKMRSHRSARRFASATLRCM